MNCHDCGMPMVAFAQRSQPRPDGFALHGARGLCHKHYQRRRLADDLDDFPSSYTAWRDIADDYAMLRREGYPLDVIAGRLGMTFDALDKALCRHSDDDRARRPNATPRWADLYGIDPNYTGGVPIEEFIAVNRGETDPTEVA